MRAFAKLFLTIDQTTSTTRRIQAIVDFFQQVEDQDKLWCIALFTHKRPKRPINSAELRSWAAAEAGMAEWLFEETYHVVGDLAETVAHIVPPAREEHVDKTLTTWIRELISMRGQDEEVRRQWVTDAWRGMEPAERFVFNKLMTGGFRIGISQKNMVKAISRFSGVEEAVVAHRLMGNWSPEDTTFEELILSEGSSDDLSRPYPFYLAYPLEDAPETLGDVGDWQAEWKWDGIRGQIMFRGGEVFIWSRGEELVTDRYPELKAMAMQLPDGTVLDGEIIVHDGEHPLSFSLLQKRIGKKSPGKKLLTEAPVKLIAYDILEWKGQDIRQQPLDARREKLVALTGEMTHANLILSQEVVAESWEELVEIRKDSRQHRAEGLMLKRKSSPYQVGRKKGDWWKWKVAPLAIDAVLIYAMRGHGRRANLYTDYTFGVWKGEELVPFAKAYSGLTDAEFREVDAFVKKHTLDRFGPVRSVEPALVFELHFEGIARSARHKSGVALRFPRMHRWRTDKPASEANTYEDLLAILEAYG